MTWCVHSSLGKRLTWRFHSSLDKWLTWHVHLNLGKWLTWRISRAVERSWCKQVQTETEPKRVQADTEPKRVQATTEPKLVQADTEPKSVILQFCILDNPADNSSAAISQWWIHSHPCCKRCTTSAFLFFYFLIYTISYGSNTAPHTHTHAPTRSLNKWLCNFETVQLSSQSPVFWSPLSPFFPHPPPYIHYSTTSTIWSA